uniref:cDNA FLJ45143 fis, clone BRAWH3040900, moderately similar to Homo sapiens cadherin, EGF LAG seven-pass G-type receptor 2 (flamingo homolog, Drosophila) (CELSR2) mRNA n=1 Tax=Homo sapiens TaxID=9606 RepID=Q6ZSX5_HUMAN|nr:unnamed protein product [Homo sapiens]
MHRPLLPLACQGPFIFLSYVVLSKEVRKALKLACSRKPSPDPALTTKSTLTSSYNCPSPYADGRLYQPYGDSAGSLHSTSRSGKSQPSYIPFLLREESALNPGQGPPGLGDPGSLFLEGQDQQHGEDRTLWPPSRAVGWLLLKVGGGGWAGCDLSLAS